MAGPSFSENQNMGILCDLGLGNSRGFRRGRHGQTQRTHPGIGSRAALRSYRDGYYARTHLRERNGS